MKTAISAVLIAVLSTALRAQVLNGDDRFPFLNEIRWDMNKESLLRVCAANKLNVSRSDTMIAFNVKAFGVEARAFVRFKSKADKPWVIEVKFKELTEKLVDTLVKHFTLTTGESPLRASKEKNLILVTMRMEFAVWKTKSEHIRLVVGKQGKSIFDINLSIQPTTS